MATSEPVIALDAMGGDHAPAEIVRGAVIAARQMGIHVAMIGQEERLVAELAKHGGQPDTISLVPASEVIEMDEHPAQGARHKKDSSMVVGLRMLRHDRAQAFVSAGNTGAIMAASIMYLGRLRGIDRPVLVALMPITGRLSLFLDVGANADCKPGYLLQFGQMASTYLRTVWKMKSPRVALLNIGEEESKGNQLSREAYDLLAASNLNFIGNVEGRDITRPVADVIVTDGFTGNVVVKTMEGMADLIRGQMESAIRSRWYYWLPGLLLRGAFQRVRRHMDYREYGAGPLLGINGLVFIAHGRSDSSAVASAIRVAREAVTSGMMEGLRAVAGSPQAQADLEPAVASTPPATGAQ